MTDRSGWPVAARQLAGAATDAVAAAQARQRQEFEGAIAALVRIDAQQVATVLGTAAEQLLERVHPDGLDAVAAQAWVEGTLRAARPWWPPVQEDQLGVALAELLGVGGFEDAPRADGEVRLAHALLLTAGLLPGTALRPAEAVDAAMAELIRAQTVELP